MPHLSESSAFYLMDFPDPLPLTTPPTSSESRAVTPQLSVTDREATRQAREQDVGQRPGTLRVKAGALKPRLFMFSYDEQGLPKPSTPTATTSCWPPFMASRN
jgi:hypothetical protein